MKKIKGSRDDNLSSSSLSSSPPQSSAAAVMPDGDCGVTVGIVVIFIATWVEAGGEGNVNLTA